MSLKNGSKNGKLFYPQYDPDTIFSIVINLLTKILHRLLKTSSGQEVSSCFVLSSPQINEVLYFTCNYSNCGCVMDKPKLSIYLLAESSMVHKGTCPGIQKIQLAHMEQTEGQHTSSFREICLFLTFLDEFGNSNMSYVCSKDISTDSLFSPWHMDFAFLYLTSGILYIFLPTCSHWITNVYLPMCSET